MAEEPNFTIRLAKIKNNRLLDRIQMVCDVYYEPKAKVTKEHIRKKIAQQFKKQNVVIFSAKKAFGGGRIRCFAMVYDSEDSMKNMNQQKDLQEWKERKILRIKKSRRKRKEEKSSKLKNTKNNRKEELSEDKILI